MKKAEKNSIASRLRRYQVSESLPWRRVAERLGVSLSMVMMVLRGERNLSARALFRFEEAEREAIERRSRAQQIVEHLIGGRDVVAGILGHGRKGQGTAEVGVDYIAGGTKNRLPTAVSLAIPPEEACRKLQALFAETLDTRLIALACLPEQLRTEGYLDHLTAESRARLTNAALRLVIPNWRSLVVRDIASRTDTE